MKEKEESEFKEKLLDFVQVLMDVAKENVLTIAEDALFPEDDLDEKKLAIVSTTTPKPTTTTSATLCNGLQCPPYQWLDPGNCVCRECQCHPSEKPPSTPSPSSPSPSDPPLLPPNPYLGPTSAGPCDNKICPKGQWLIIETCKCKDPIDPLIY